MVQQHAAPTQQHTTPTPQTEAPNTADPMVELLTSAGAGNAVAQDVASGEAQASGWLDGAMDLVGMGVEAIVELALATTPADEMVWAALELLSGASIVEVLRQLGDQTAAAWVGAAILRGSVAVLDALESMDPEALLALMQQVARPALEMWLAEGGRASRAILDAVWPVGVGLELDARVAATFGFACVSASGSVGLRHLGGGMMAVERAVTAGGGPTAGVGGSVDAGDGRARAELGGALLVEGELWERLEVDAISVCGAAVIASSVSGFSLTPIGFAMESVLPELDAAQYRTELKLSAEARLEGEAALGLTSGSEGLMLLVAGALASRGVVHLKDYVADDDVYSLVPESATVSVEASFAVCVEVAAALGLQVDNSGEQMAAARMQFTWATDADGGWTFGVPSIELAYGVGVEEQNLEVGVGFEEAVLPDSLDSLLRNLTHLRLSVVSPVGAPMWASKLLALAPVLFGPLGVVLGATTLSGTVSFEAVLDTDASQFLANRVAEPFLAVGDEAGALHAVEAWLSNPGEADAEMMTLLGMEVTMGQVQLVLDVALRQEAELGGEVGAGPAVGGELEGGVELDFVRDLVPEGESLTVAEAAALLAGQVTGSVLLALS